MNKKISSSFAVITILIIGGFLAFVFVQGTNKASAPTKVNENENEAKKGDQIANPASEHCVNNEGKLEIRTNADGSQTGYCVFKNGNECEEWAYFRGECGKIDISDWNTYKNIKNGYEFKFPADWTIDDKNIDKIILLIVTKDYSAPFYISVFSVGEGYDIDNLIRKQLSEEVKNGRKIQKEEMMIDGEKGYSVMDCGKFECVTQKWAVVRNGKFYFLKSGNTLLPEFEQVFKTFKFIK